MVDAGARNNYNTILLHFASEGGHLKIVRMLLDRGADVNARDKNSIVHCIPLCDMNCEFLRTRSIYTYMLIPGTSLWFTRSREQQGDHVRVAKLLLKFGADSYARDNNNNTALHLASQKRHVQVVEILLDCGADPNARNKDNRASLDLASEAEYVKVVRLLRYHADLNACENEHHRPFHLAW